MPEQSSAQNLKERILVFKDKYTKDVEKIKLDGSLKQYVKAKMRQEKAPKRSSIKSIGVLAALVCICIVASVFLTPKNPASVVKPIVDKKDKVLLAGMKYSEIYDAITLARQNGSDNESYFEIIEDDSGVLLGPDSATGTLGANKGEITNTNDNSTTTQKPTHSTTNNQVEGIDETDIVKTDGEYIYVCKQNTIKIAKAQEGELEFVGSIEIEETYMTEGIFLSENRIAVILSEHGKDVNTVLRMYDLSDKTNPQNLGEVFQTGEYFNSRMIGKTVYLLTNYYVGYDIEEETPSTYIPTIGNKLVTESNITCINNFTSTSYLVISAISVEEIKSTAGKAILGGAENIYCDEDNLYFTFTKSKGYNEIGPLSTSYIVKLGFFENTIKTEAMGEVYGTPLNQFSLDEYEGNLRIVTTVNENVQRTYEELVSSKINGTTASNLVSQAASSTLEGEASSAFVGTSPFVSSQAVSSAEVETFSSSEWVPQSSSYLSQSESGSISSTYTITVTEKYNVLYVLDKNLKVIGKTEKLAQNEQVYSVRFDGNIGYFVTYRQIDPLFTVDLSDPTKPTVLSELKIPGFSEYLHTFGEGKLFGFGQSGTGGLKLSMFDVSDPANVTEENKTEIANRFSEASANHKAIMVDVDKNIIAFAAADYLGTFNVYVYGYDEQNGFFIKKTNPIGKADLTTARFIWIEDYFYLVCDSKIVSFSMSDFEQISEIEF